MTYAQFDDGYADHPKIAVLSDAAYRAHSESICYCTKYLTDGAIPQTVANRLARGRHKALAELTEGDPPLWVSTSSGYYVRDFLQWNKSRAQVEAYRRKKVTAGRASVVARGGTPVETDDGTEGSTGVLVGEESFAFDVGLDSKNMAFDDFWSHYPRRVGKLKAREEWVHALAGGAVAGDIIAAAARFAADPNRDPKFTAHPATWLHQGRWMDEAPEPRSSKRSVALVLADDLERQGL